MTTDPSVAPEGLDAAAVRRWILASADELEARSDEIDALNVFPVADSDTGTNLARTFLRASRDALAQTPGSAGEALRIAATAAVLGARGNSGVIAAQLLRSFSVTAAGADLWTAHHLAVGLRQGVTDVYSAVTDPVEGTMLTVTRAAAEALEGRELALGALIAAVVTAAEDALWHTTEQLAPLARAGVIDAGALGLTIIFDVLAEVVFGERLMSPQRPPVIRTGAVLTGLREMGSDKYEYEVQYLLDTDEASIEQLRQRLGEIGDSVVIVGTGELTFNVHVHVEDVGAALEAGIALGRAHRITVVHLSDESGGGQPVATALIVVEPEPGTGELFAAEGVHVTDSDVNAIVAAIGQARQVVVLHTPFAAEPVALAVAQARTAGARVAVVPIRSAVQGLAAVAVHDGERAFDDDVVAMAEAAAATRFAQISLADSAGLTSVGPCRAGDVLGMIDGEVVEIGDNIATTALSVADRVLGVGAELITLLVGANAPEAMGEMFTRHVRVHSALIEVTIYESEQLAVPLLIGIE